MINICICRRAGAGMDRMWRRERKVGPLALRAAIVVSFYFRS